MDQPKPEPAAPARQPDAPSLSENLPSDAAFPSARPVGIKNRLLSLDVFRGITLAAMLIANNPGEWRNILPPFKHAAWDGCTFTDLIFPAFVFIMGVAMTFSFARRLSEGGDKMKLFVQLVRRTLILIGLGLLLAGFSYWLLHNPESARKFRFPGVLQRLALCYFFAGLVLLSGLRAWGQAIVAGILLVGYHVLMKHVPVPGFGAGMLGPGGGNWASYLDDKIFGAHGYKFLKETNMWHDPEGLLSTIPAVATALLGTITGYTVRDYNRTDFEKVAVMATWGFALVIGGWLWNYSFPMNKNLWTPSFVLFAGGWSLLGVAATYYVTDIRRITWWTKPFVVLGTNAIVTYVSVGIATILSIYLKVSDGEGGEISVKTWLYRTLVQPVIEPLLGPAWASLGYGVFYIGVWTLLVGVLLYRKRIFIRI